MREVTGVGGLGGRGVSMLDVYGTGASLDNMREKKINLVGIQEDL